MLNRPSPPLVPPGVPSWRAARRLRSRFASTVRRLAALWLCWIVFGPRSSAATLTWDANTSAAGAQDGAGTWNPASTNWYNGTADVAWPNVTDTAVFGAGVAGTYAITVGTVNAGAITFNQGGYTLSGGTVTMNPVNASTGFTLTTTGGTDTISSPLTGAANSRITKTGAGTLVLGTVTASPVVATVNGGTLSLAAGGGAGTLRGPVTVNPGATLSLTATDALGYTAGTQVTVLNVNGSTVDNAAPTSSGNRNQGYRTSFNLTGGSMTNSGGGNYLLAAGDATAPGITSNASATTSLITANVSISGGTLGVNVASGATPGGIDLQTVGFFASGSLTKNGNGVLALNGGSTYAGATTINAGTVVLNPSLTMVSGGTGKNAQVKSSLTGQGASLANSNITLNPSAALRLIAGDLPVTLGATPAATTPLSGNITATGLNNIRIATPVTPTPGTYDVLTTNQAGLGAGTFQLDGATSLTIPAVSLIKQFDGTTNTGGTNGGTFYRLTLQKTATAVQVVVSPAPANVINVMPMGSSTTEGFSSQPDGYSGGGYRSALYQALVNDGRFTPNFVGSNTVLDAADSGAYNVLSAANQLHHEGHGGYVSQQVLTSVNYGAAWLATDAQGQPTNGVVPDYITLAIGSNDFSILAKSTSPHPIPATDLAGPLNRNDAIITYIANTLRPNANIIIGTFHYRVETNSGDIEVIGDLQNTYYNALLPGMVFNHVLAGHHVSMADLYGAVTPGNDMSNVGPDGIHCLTTGYNLMANVWYNALASGSAYWTGGQNNQWSTVIGSATNFAQNYQLTTPRQTALTASTDVHFNRNTAALPTTLGQDISVRGVNFAAGATGPVTVGGANTLTLGVGGITAQAGTGAHTISAKVALGSNQTWGNVSGSPLTVSGVVSGGYGLTLTTTWTIQDQVNAANNDSSTVTRSFTGPGSFVLSGANTYTGGTTLNSGTLVVNNASGSGTGPGPVNVAGGATLTDSGTISGDVTVNGMANGTGAFGGAVTVNSGGTFSGAATISGPLNVNAGGLVALSGGTLSVGGGVVNNGTVRLTHGASLAVGGSAAFVNNGTLDIITGVLNAPGGFTNNGIVIDSRVVQATSVNKTGGVLTVTVNGYTGHAYQLQRSDSLAGSPFTNLGSPQSGVTGTVLTFQDASPSSAEGFYRVVVDP